VRRLADHPGLQAVLWVADWQSAWVTPNLLYGRTRCGLNLVDIGYCYRVLLPSSARTDLTNDNLK
jgi:hypothetical protein